MTGTGPESKAAAFPYAEHFHRLAAEFAESLSYGRESHRRFQAKLQTCKTIEDLKEAVPPWTVAALRRHRHPLEDLLRDREQTLQRHAALRATDCGREVIPRAGRMAWRAFRKGPLTQPVRLWQHVRMHSRPLPRSGADFGELWLSVVIPVLRDEFPKMFMGNGDDVWHKPTAHRAACVVLAELCEDSVADRSAARGKRFDRKDAETEHERLCVAAERLSQSHRDVFEIYLRAKSESPPEAKLTASEVYRWWKRNQESEGDAFSRWNEKSFATILSAVLKELSIPKNRPRRGRSGRNVFDARHL